MTNSPTFKRVVETALAQGGFKKHGKAWRFDGEDVSIIVGLQKIEYSRQVFVNVGFWLKKLGDDPPEKVELTHMYYRLERLCPEHREAILAAGDESAAQHQHWLDSVAPILTSECLPQVKAWTSTDAVRAAFLAGKLSGGLIRKEARQLLSAE